MATVITDRTVSEVDNETIKLFADLSRSGKDKANGFITCMAMFEKMQRMAEQSPAPVSQA